MKNLLFISMILAVFSFSACGQKEAPAKVKTAFSQKFPGAKKVKWDKENANEWEAEFKWKGEEYSANFGTDGTWKETEYEIEKSDLPAAVKATLESEFKDYDIEEVEVSETPEGKVFEFAMENDETDYSVAISPSGKVTEKEKKQEENEEQENDEK